MKRKISIGLVLVLVFAVGFGTAIATTGDSQITATLSRTITVAFNGEAQEFRDVNNNQVFPIVYQGTTYLPVRAVADLFGVPVDWDNATRTVLLGDAPGGAVPPAPPAPATGSLLDAGTWTTGGGARWDMIQGAANVPGGAEFTSAARGRTGGFGVRTFTINEARDTLTFTATATTDRQDANVSVQIRNAATDIVLFDEQVPVGSFNEFTVNLDGATQLQFRISGPVTGSNNIYLLNPTLR